MLPFLLKDRNGFSIKLNKKLYPKDLFRQVRQEDPDAILSLRSKGDYYLLDLNTCHKGDYYDFLNLLIYLKKNR